MIKKDRAFASFAVKDLAAAKDFYGNTLGLDVSEDEMGILNLTFSDQTKVIVYPKDDHAPANFTVLNLPVDNLDTTVDDLTGKGVRFETYDFGEIKTDEKGIMRGGPGPAIAWFTDPAGNIVSVLEE
ncbi:MAG: VOC family protein [Actinomycetota bacterium]